MSLDAVWDVLMFVVLPLWVLAGFADYCCHRATGIEFANGAKESVLHWLMLAEVGLPILAALFLRVNALLFLFMLVCFVAHEVTTYRDLKLAMATRKVTAFEQQVHSVMEIMPLTALLLLAILHWNQARALFGFGPDHADFALALKPPPALSVLFPALAAVLISTVLPYAEELARGIRVQARRGVRN